MKHWNSLRILISLVSLPAQHNSSGLLHKCSHCFSIFSADNTKEHSEYAKTLAERLAEKYSNSAYYQETKAVLENISSGNKKKTKAISRQIPYANSFLHQLKWVSKRTFKNLVRNPQASIAQVTLFVSKSFCDICWIYSTSVLVKLLGWLRHLIFWLKLASEKRAFKVWKWDSLEDDVNAPKWAAWGTVW